MKKAALALSLSLITAPLFAAVPKAVPPIKQFVEASGQGNVAELARLLKAGVSVNGRLTPEDNSMTALTIAAALGKVESVKALLAAKANVNLADALGDTPLHKACFPPISKDQASEMKAKREIVGLLLAAKAKVNLKDKQGWTPLMFAASVGDASNVKALLDAGADASVKLSSGKTAFSLAQQGGSKDAAALLTPKPAVKK